MIKPFIQLVEQIYENFKQGKYTLGMFIDLGKAFDTVDRKILLRKVEIYGIGGITKNLKIIQQTENNTFK